MLSIVLASLIATKDRTLNVFAAASLKEAFTSLSRKYEATHPGLRIRLNFAGSQTLASQINHGASADVFASASARNLNETPHDRGSYRIFALNRLTVAVRKGLPGVRSLADLSKVRHFVVADKGVPVGQYTDRFLIQASKIYGKGWLEAVYNNIVTWEADVKSVLAKVRLGEGDAGVVYSSDLVHSRGAVGEIRIPEGLNQIAEYPVAIPSYAENKEDAKDFISYLLEDASQKAFEQNGFISVTKPVGSLTISFPGNTLFLQLPFRNVGRVGQVHAADKKKVMRNYRGVLVSSLPGLSAAKSATFIGADRFSQAFSISELRVRKAVLVRQADGNYQLIIPGMKPSVWVNWLRRIEVR
jgi:molybdate transport system substrate-binding protein